MQNQINIAFYGMQLLFQTDGQSATGSQMEAGFAVFGDLYCFYLIAPKIRN